MSDLNDAGAAAPGPDNAAPISAPDTAAPAPQPPQTAEEREAALDVDLRAVFRKNREAQEQQREHRDARGRYAKPEGADAPGANLEQKPAGAEQGDAAAQDSSDQPKDKATEQAPPAIAPPLSWSADMKAKWAALPPDVQTYLAERDRDTHSKISQLGDKHRQFEDYRKAFEPFEQLVSEHADYFRSQNVDPVHAYRWLVNAHQTFKQNPVAALVQLGDEARIDLRPFFQAMGARMPQPASPEVVELKRTIDHLSRQVADTTGKLTEREKAEKEAADAEVKSVITKWSDGKPYFEEVRSKMAVLLQNGEATDLDDAYDQAINASKTIRERIREDQRKQEVEKAEAARKAEQAKRDEEAKAHANAARRAGSVNLKPSPATQPIPKSWEDTVEAVGRESFRKAS